VALSARPRGRQLLYWWPDDGWQRSMVACGGPSRSLPARRRVLARGAVHTADSDVAESALRGTADSDSTRRLLLDSASYDAAGPAGWVLLSGSGSPT
jgi:hypothetical protein